MARKVVGFVVVLVVVVGLRLMQHSGDSSEVREQFREFVAELPSYETRSEYLDQILDMSHEVAFTEAYSAGTRRRGAEIDGHKYLEVLMREMIDHCQSDEEHDLIPEIQSLRESIEVVE
ncbi:MAG: hypothetical protein ACPGXK_04650 [Phycisphaerae bacterium]